jgi:hypothetical protein
MNKAGKTIYQIVKTVLFIVGILECISLECLCIALRFDDIRAAGDQSLGL